MSEKTLSEALEEASIAFQEAMKHCEEEQEKFWKSLPEEDRLKAFCAVVRRIHDGEIRHKSSYRYILYDIFGFGYEAYAQAQDAGYLDIHNSIADSSYDHILLTSFCERYKVEDHESKIKEFIGKE